MHEPIDETPEEEQDEIMTIEGFKTKYPFAYRMEVEVAEAFASEEQIAVADVLMLIRNLFTRTRAVLTYDELHAWAHKLLQDAEALLQMGQAFVDMDGNPQNMLLAEEREELGTNTVEIPDTVPEDWS